MLKKARCIYIYIIRNRGMKYILVSTLITYIRMLTFSTIQKQRLMWIRTFRNVRKGSVYINKKSVMWNSSCLAHSFFYGKMCYLYRFYFFFFFFFFFFFYCRWILMSFYFIIRIFQIWSWPGSKWFSKML